MEINKKSSYKSISINLKNDLNKVANPDGTTDGGAAASMAATSNIASQQQEIKMSKNEADLN